MSFKEYYSKQIQWLLDGDPSIRYQTLRDLTDSDDKAVKKEQDRILEEGWGKRFIDLQEAAGSWSNALYSPKWTSTFYTLLLLKRFGAIKNHNTEMACQILLDKGFNEKDGGINYWKSWKQGECCVTGMLVSMLCHFQYRDSRINRMVEYLLSQQMPDDGWNCERPKGAKHSSFHTTISVLEGLWEYEQKYPTSDLIKSIQQKTNEGIEFLLKHQLYKSNTTWKTVDSKMVKLIFPPRWHFDIMRCLDFFQERKLQKDKRMNGAIELLSKKQTPEGFWKLEGKYPARIFFEMEKVGQISRWNTLRALRIIKWWNN